MPRTLSSPNNGGSVSNVLPISSGGTNANSLAQAATNLGGLKNTQLGVANYAAKSDASGKVPLASLPAMSGTVTPTIIGEMTVYVNQTKTYFISNYDSNTTYTVTSTLGTVSRVGDTITYVTGAVVGNSGLTINGQAIPVVINTAAVIPPSILAPVDGYTAVTRTPTSTSSVFAVGGSTDTHLSSSWQIATDAAFINIVQSSIDSTTNKTSWTLAQLAANTLYYIRCQHKGSILGYSVWGAANSFTTGT